MKMIKVSFDWLKRTLVVLPLAGCANQDPPIVSQPFDGNYAPITEYLSTFIEREMKAENLTGLSIALVDNQKMVWSKGFGLADKALNIRASNKTRYRVASISKLFNAVAIMQEVERGNLDLDTAVVEYVPGFRINSRFGPTTDITLRNLLTHPSGLPEGHRGGKWSHDPISLEGVPASLSTTHTAYPANSYSSYSNIGVNLSGLVLQTKSGKQYDEYMHEFLLHPLQMIDSNYSKKASGVNTAIGYDNAEVVGPLQSTHMPAGGLISTVDDMANFMISMLGKGRFGEAQLLSVDSFDEMMRVQNTQMPLDLLSRMGLAWFYNFGKLGGVFDVVGHSGSKHGHTSRLSLVPELGIGVIVLTNNAEKSGAKERIVHAALQQLYLTRGLQDQQSNDAKSHQTIDANEILPGDYAGTEGLIRMSRKKDKMHAKSLHVKQAFILKKNSDNWYTPRLTFKGIPLPVTDDIRVTGSTIDGRDLLITQEDGWLEIIGERIEPQAESDTWSDRIGYYKHTETEHKRQSNIDGVSLLFGDDYYLIEFHYKVGTNHRRAVQPISESALVELGLGRGYGNTITYSESSGTPTLNYLGYLFELEATSLDNPSRGDQ